LDRPAHRRAAIAVAGLAIASCSARAASSAARPTSTTSLAGATSATPTSAPTDLAVATAATRVVVDLLEGGLGLACRDSLCTPELASAIDTGTTATEATSADVVDTRSLNNDGYIATVEVWIEDQHSEGSLRSYRITLVRLADGTWRATGVTP
jgi:hypothetical protein